MGMGILFQAIFILESNAHITVLPLENGRINAMFLVFIPLFPSYFQCFLTFCF